MPAPSRYAGTQIGPDGKRVPIEDPEAAAGPSRLSVSEVDPDTQIAADGTRVPTDLAGDITKDRNAESLFREERAGQIEAGENPPVHGTGISADVATTAEATGQEPAADDDDDAAGDGEGVDGMTKAELLDVAADLEIEGRTTMNKAELLEAVKAAQQ